MSWQDIYREHELWDVTAETLAVLEELDSPSDEVAQLKALLTRIGAFRKKPDPTLTVHALNIVLQKVRDIEGQTPDVDRIFAANSGRSDRASLMDELARSVRSWPDSARARIDSLSSEVEHAEAAATSLGERVIEAENETREKIEKYRQTAYETIDSTLDQLRAAQEDIRKESAEVVESSRKTAAEAADEFRADIQSLREQTAGVEDTVEKQKTRLDDALNTIQEKFDKEATSRDQAWDQHVKEREKKAEGLFSSLEQTNKEAQGILSALSKDSTSSYYSSYANVQAGKADFWRNLAVGAFGLAAIIFVGMTVMSFAGLGADLSWWEVVGQKVAAPGGFAAVGAFCARESGQHRKQERAARENELILTAVHPFIVHLPEEMQEAIQMETARRLFVKPIEKDASPGKE
ncbi:hypothetical protein [Brevibacterium oceani]|uniref:hypothetical protein n=1 Tax=Brevibacterium oceani TaxID=358099 RepID=UPI0015E6CB85|nr:hypothetical protein [Brevibacterium oceani]